MTTIAGLTVRVIIDLLSGRCRHPDEVIEVLDPIEWPFDRTGALCPLPPGLMLTPAARGDMTAAAAEVHPAETGGILIGVRSNAGEVCVTDVVEFRPDKPTRHRYEVPDGVTQDTVDRVHAGDARKEYVGEWPSHPTDQPASPTDTATMAALGVRREAGDPVLCVLRPLGDDRFNIDAYLPIHGRLVPVGVLDVGPLSPEETT